jgi:hypothetical protein
MAIWMRVLTPTFTGPTSHYVLAWMTATEVTLQPTDLYPAPKPGTKLALREHYVRMPAGMNYTAGR